MKLKEINKKDLRWMIYLLLFVIGFALLAFFVGKKSIEQNEALGNSNELQGQEDFVEDVISKGDKALDFSFKTLEGEDMKLSDFRGEHILLNFWGLWCPACQEELPILDELDKEIADLQVITINLLNEDETDDDIINFLSENEIDVLTAIDREAEYFSLYKGQLVPMSILIDEEFNVIETFIGITDKEVIRELVEF